MQNGKELIHYWRRKASQKNSKSKLIMIKWVIILSTFLLNREGMAQSDSDSAFFNRYMQIGDEKFEKKKNRGEGEFYDAINAYNTAMLIYPEMADSARKRIKVVFDEIQRVSAENEKGKVEIQRTLKEVVKARDAFEEQKKKAEEAREEFYLFNLANAPYKYVRLIRDGPKDADKIKKANFDLNLIAYSNHLDSLRNILSDSLTSHQEQKISGAKLEYDHLRENLYYNNEFYEKIYYCLESNHLKGNILDDELEQPGPDYFNVQYFRNGNDTFRISISEKEGAITGHSANSGYDTLKRDGQSFTSFALSGKQRSLFCATDDNYIFVYSAGDSGDLTIVDSIAMGAKVTALDFDESSNILFFGTGGGDIGFIEYNGNKSKYQPVYSTENFLAGSLITAIDIFVKEDSTYLLAAGFDGKGVVYKIDGNNPVVPGNKFSGNILPNPKKDFGDILHAKFDEKSGRILIETSKDAHFYLWDPFTESVLENYKKEMKFLYESGDEKSKKETRLSIMDATNYYKNLN